MKKCPECAGKLYSSRFKTVSTERGGAYTVYSYVTYKCALDCGFSKTVSNKAERIEFV
ncbi:hypothetical protein SAMN04488053_101562 [Alkalicoccus daliensis]|uniref:Uncharacterized protein n=1 Tax=Alkalicoccus daliensis TaxID=745820 RepID=A0A1H0APB6_9BACI|nr:hypothetical protein SAMN04488053_101562 [Alkalicoccus daliensis]